MSVQGDRGVISRAMGELCSWFADLAALWKAMSSHHCMWSLVSRSLVGLFAWEDLDPMLVTDMELLVCCLLFGVYSSVFQNNGAQQLLG